GQGGIADLLPKDRTRCVEISPLHCDILRKKGHNVIEGDFLSWNPGVEFSVIAMNPPFSEGRWQAHLKHAGSLVADGGRIGAVLPLSARSKAADLLPGFDLEFSEPISNAFSGTSISVILLKAVKR
ncbi:MAG: restriction endonuclease subunit M, partial [Pseudomonas sp.]|nr:restriction endonuclease subunit M [Pseudomonas sp.]